MRRELDQFRGVTGFVRRLDELVGCAYGDAQAPHTNE